jgi:hypothetical protein
MRTRRSKVGFFNLYTSVFTGVLGKLHMGRLAMNVASGLSKHKRLSIMIITKIVVTTRVKYHIKQVNHTFHISLVITAYFSPATGTHWNAFFQNTCKTVFAIMMPTHCLNRIIFIQRFITNRAFFPFGL